MCNSTKPEKTKSMQVKRVPRDLVRHINVAAFDAGLTQREFVNEIVQEHFSMQRRSKATRGRARGRETRHMVVRYMSRHTGASMARAPKHSQNQPTARFIVAP